MCRKNNIIALILLFILLQASFVAAQKVYVNYDMLPDTLAFGDIVILRPLPTDGNGWLFSNLTDELFLPTRTLMLHDTTKKYTFLINAANYRKDDYCQKISEYEAKILRRYFEENSFFPSSIKYEVIGKGNSEAFFTFDEYINSTGYRRALIYMLNNRIELRVE